VLTLSGYIATAAVSHTVALYELLPNSNRFADARRQLSVASEGVQVRTNQNLRAQFVACTRIFQFSAARLRGGQLNLEYREYREHATKRPTTPLFLRRNYKHFIVLRISFCFL